MNFILVTRNERDDLVAIGLLSIDYESAGCITVGIARALTEDQARTLGPRLALTGGKPLARPLPGVTA